MPTSSSAVKEIVLPTYLDLKALNPHHELLAYFTLEGENLEHIAIRSFMRRFSCQLGEEEVAGMKLIKKSDYFMRKNYENYKSALEKAIYDFIFE